VNVNFAHLCDYASVSREGKLSVMGIFDRITVAVVPSMHPMLYLAFQLELFPAELGRPFKVAIRVVDADGNAVLETDADAKIDGQAKPGEMARSPQVVGFASLPLRKAGRHSIDIFLNGDHKANTTFDVIVASAAAGSTPTDLPK
jgi:hypothetical protein